MMKKNERGIYLVLMTAALPVLLAIGMFSYDLGRLYLLRSKLQNISDLASLAGLRQYARDLINKTKPADIANNVRMAATATIQANDTAKLPADAMKIGPIETGIFTPAAQTSGPQFDPVPAGHPSFAAVNAVRVTVSKDTGNFLFKFFFPEAAKHNLEIKAVADLACPPGSFSKDGACLTCPAGFTWNGTTCVGGCPKEKEGLPVFEHNGQCLTCPNGTSWNGADCIKTTTTPGTPPPVVTSSGGCSHCPYGGFTYSEGGASVDFCNVPNGKYGAFNADLDAIIFGGSSVTKPQSNEPWTVGFEGHPVLCSFPDQNKAGSKIYFKIRITALTDTPIKNLYHGLGVKPCPNGYYDNHHGWHCNYIEKAFVIPGLVRDPGTAIPPFEADIRNITGLRERDWTGVIRISPMTGGEGTLHPTFWGAYSTPNFDTDFKDYLPGQAASSSSTTSARFPGCNEDNIVIGGKTWAACNVGAKTSAEYGNLLLWSEVQNTATGCPAGWRMPGYDDYLQVGLDSGLRLSKDWTPVYNPNNFTAEWAQLAKILKLPYGGIGHTFYWGDLRGEAGSKGAYWLMQPMSDPLDAAAALICSEHDCHPNSSFIYNFAHSKYMLRCVDGGGTPPTTKTEKFPPTVRDRLTEPPAKEDPQIRLSE